MPVSSSYDTRKFPNITPIAQMGNPTYLEGTFDAVGIGVGPSNLSVASLIAAVPDLTFVAFDQRPDFAWHHGSLLSASEMQVSHLKDLVSLVDPTNPYSFLAFLHAKRRLYQFVNARFPAVRRIEFDQYLSWVASKLNSVHFGQRVTSIDFDDEDTTFNVTLEDKIVRTRNVVLGLGAVPAIPECARNYLGSTVVHSSTYNSVRPHLAGKVVTVIGGGQSGAELVADLLSANSPPVNITWISKRDNFLPIDDSPFVNEYYTPSYVKAFSSFGAAARQTLLNSQILSSDGISDSVVRTIYRLLYEHKFLRSDPTDVVLLPSRKLIALSPIDGRWELGLQHHYSHAVEHATADFVILATGYHSQSKDILKPLAKRLSWSGAELELGEHFSAIWDGPPDRRILVQNGARAQRGIADPNLSLMAWRAALIVNCIAGRSVYDGLDDLPFVSWNPTHKHGAHHD